MEKNMKGYIEVEIVDSFTPLIQFFIIVKC